VPPLPDPNGVFLNIPYDAEFSSLYIAYIVGICQLGLKPHIASEIPGGKRRLDRILELIQGCRYSIHDLSRVEVSPSPSAVPRFNMPLELGMTITREILHPEQHTWFVWESEPYRLQRSLSDLNGTDANIHNDKTEDVLSGLRNALGRDHPPPVPQMRRVYDLVKSALDSIFSNSGTRNPYDRSVFIDLCRLSRSLGNFYPSAKPAIEAP
jgi:hypothetical protein